MTTPLKTKMLKMLKQSKIWLRMYTLYVRWLKSSLMKLGLLLMRKSCTNTHDSCLTSIDTLSNYCLKIKAPNETDEQIVFMLSYRSTNNEYKVIENLNAVIANVKDMLAGWHTHRQTWMFYL